MNDKAKKVGTKSDIKRLHTYKDVLFDCDGWADVNLFLPIDYDLCLLKTDHKTYVGWNTGSGWDGLQVPDNLHVLYWKRQIDSDLHYC